MDPKARKLMSDLQSAFPEGYVEYRFDNELHKYRFNHAGPSHWLYIAREFVEDHTEQELVDALDGCQVPLVFRDSPNSLRLFLSENGFCEVDAKFGRGE